MNCSFIILSCDKYNACWQPFFALLDKYWKGHPKTYLVTETKQCEYSNTININSDCWTERFRKALEQIDTDYVIVMLEDFFIRQPVDTERIDYCLSQINDDIAVFNFEKNVFNTTSNSGIKGFKRKDNKSQYMNSCQPSLHNRLKLIERLQANQNAWEWELSQVDSDYLFYINDSDIIINIGYYGNQPWGITQGKWTKECIDFLGKENIQIDFNERGIL